MKQLGDYDLSAVIYDKFTTYRPSTGASFTLAGSPALSVYKDNSTTQSTTGVSLTADFDSVTGLNHYAIDTSADPTFYSAGSFFEVVITTGTVDSISVTGSVVACFTIRKNSALKPATAGRTLVVDSAGLADANMVKVGPTGAGTAQTAGDIPALVNTVDDFLDTEIAAIKAKTDSLPASPANEATLSTIAGYLDTEVAAIKAKTDNLPSDPADASDIVAAFATVNATLSTIAGYLDTEVAAIKAKTDALPADPADASDLAASFAAIGAAIAALNNLSASGVAAAVLDASTAAHATPGTVGKAITDASSAGDPWSTALPGAYGSGTAGKIVGDNLNATVSSRSTLDSGDVQDAVDAAFDAPLAEMTSVPAANASIRQKIAAWFVTWRNKKVATDDGYIVYADDDTTPIATVAAAEVSDVLTIDKAV